MRAWLWILLALSSGPGQDLVYLKFQTEAGCRKVEKVLEARHFEARCFPQELFADRGLRA